jgi:hypothetical protein
MVQNPIMVKLPSLPPEKEAPPTNKRPWISWWNNSPSKVTPAADGPDDGKSHGQVAVDLSGTVRRPFRAGNGRPQSSRGSVAAYESDGDSDESDDEEEGGRNSVGSMAISQGMNARDGSIGEGLMRVMDKGQSRRKASKWQNNRCLSNKRRARAFYGPILSIMERPAYRGRWATLLNMVPFASLAILFMQLNSLNGFVLPDVSGSGVDVPYRGVKFAFALNYSGHGVIGLTLAILSCLVLLPFLAFLFYWGNPTEVSSHAIQVQRCTLHGGSNSTDRLCLWQAVMCVPAAYINILSGSLYMPILKQLVLALITEFRGTGGHVAYAIVCLVIMTLFVPFVLGFTQNKVLRSL